MLNFSLWKKILVSMVLFWAFVMALPNLLSTDMRQSLPEYLPQKTVNLGLDLQGGAHLVLQVDMNAAVRQAYKTMEEGIKTQLRDRASGTRIRYRNMRTDTETGITFRLKNTEKTEQVTKKLRGHLSGVFVKGDNQGTVNVIYTQNELSRMRKNALEQTLEILRMRVDEFGVSEPLIQRQGDDRVIIELPGVTNIGRAKSIIGRTAQLTFHLVNESARAGRRLPAGTGIFHERIRNENGAVVQEIPYYLNKRPAVTGERLNDANSAFDEFGNPIVSLSFDSRGTRKFAKLTSENVGSRMAIVLDGEVYSAPVLREPILGGNAQISGNFTVTQANDLATVLRAGALPAPIKIVEERTVGPSLGADSIKAGTTAVIYGFIAVLILMIIFYGGFGLAANIALLFNVLFILAIMTLLGATLTLPGIAGIVLTIGMAVDANILIFERIREETRRGLTPILAFDKGFSSAFSTILDANITTLIAAIVLFGMGSGPIKGFALTLCVGILASMFTAIMVTRWQLLSWLLWVRPKTLKS